MDWSTLWVSVVSGVLISFLSAVGGVLWSSARQARKRVGERDERQRERDTAIEEGVRALLFDKLSRMHRVYVTQQRPCPLDVKERAEQIYLAYHTLGGNGIGTHMRDEIISAHRGPTPPPLPPRPGAATGLDEDVDGETLIP